MMSKLDNAKCCADYLSPLKLTLLAVNAICFGGCVVLLAAGRGDGPVVLLTIGVGLMLFTGLTGALIAACRTRAQGL